MPSRDEHISADIICGCRSRGLTLLRIFPISDTDDIEMLPMWSTHILRAQRGHSAHLVVGTLLATRAVCDSNKDTRVVRKICFILLERDIEYIILLGCGTVFVATRTVVLSVRAKNLIGTVMSLICTAPYNV